MDKKLAALMRKAVAGFQATGAVDNAVTTTALMEAVALLEKASK